MIAALVLSGLRCPACAAALSGSDGDAICCPGCGASYPIVDGIPVVIPAEGSVFKASDFTAGRSTFFDLSPRGRALARAGAALSSLAGATRASARNYRRLREELGKRGGRPRVLILGGSVAGAGLAALLDGGALDVVESDVSFGPRTQIILDAHRIPYAGGSFDAVVAQAVLEHVLDPWRCVAEIHRVLKPEGLVYAETPFMQQVHGGAYDFTRFSRSGHRRLFRQFGEVASGAIAGPGTVMAWSWEHLLVSLFGYGRPLVLAAKAVGRVTGFWLKLLDPVAALNRRSVDAASCLYFLGRRAERPLGDEEIVAYYEAR